jgi:2-polyprenyl-3-methyl-5-hydroxy-6-metoxy-1,4-benzoquinol methylase
MAHLIALVLLASAEWTSFLAWYKTYSGPVMPPDVMKAYAAVLSGQGKSDADIKATLGSLQKTFATGPRDMLTLHFNKVYNEHPELFSAAPNAFLVRMVKGMKPGAALDVAMGQGRNSVYLAQQGWDVTGYDLSDQGMALARAAAERAGVRIRTVEATHQEFDFGHERWDLIVMTYSFVNMQDTGFLARIRDSLRPGGVVVLEQMNSGGTGKGPANALLRSFEGLRVLHYEDAVDIAEWSHQPARLGRIVVQKE